MGGDGGGWGGGSGDVIVMGLQKMLTSSMAASPCQPTLRAYENFIAGALTDTVAVCQLLPLLPLLLHRVVPPGDFMLSVPIWPPYM